MLPLFQNTRPSIDRISGERANADIICIYLRRPRRFSLAAAGTRAALVFKNFPQCRRQRVTLPICRLATPPLAFKHVSQHHLLGT